MKSLEDSASQMRHNLSSRLSELKKLERLEPRPPKENNTNGSLTSPRPRGRSIHEDTRREVMRILNLKDEEETRLDDNRTLKSLPKTLITLDKKPMLSEGEQTEEDVTDVTEYYSFSEDEVEDPFGSPKPEHKQHSLKRKSGSFFPQNPQ